MYPTRGVLPACCARAASGHAAAAPANRVMNSRRFTRSPRRRPREAGRHSQAERSRRLEIEYRFELGRRLYRKVGGLGPAQDAVDIGCRLPKLFHAIAGVAHETTGHYEITERVDCRQAVPGRQRDNEVAMDSDRVIRQQNQAAVRYTREGLDGAFDVGVDVLDGSEYGLDRE